MTYHKPPDDYTSPAIDPGCLVCGNIISFVPVIGGFKWVHLSNTYDDHEVEMGRWWDTTSGKWVEGNELREDVT
jgi:hypothetical protein